MLPSNLVVDTEIFLITCLVKDVLIAMKWTTPAQAQDSVEPLASAQAVQFFRKM
jgi:hypothetical protein